MIQKNMEMQEIGEIKYIKRQIGFNTENKKKNNEGEN